MQQSVSVVIVRHIIISRTVHHHSCFSAVSSITTDAMPTATTTSHCCFISDGCATTACRVVSICCGVIHDFFCRSKTAFSLFIFLCICNKMFIAMKVLHHKRLHSAPLARRNIKIWAIGARARKLAKMQENQAKRHYESTVIINCSLIIHMKH